MHRLLATGSAMAWISVSGCVERTLRVTSEPPGATVVLNHREVGVTPCDVEFTHYGTYDVELRHDGFISWIGARKVAAPLWDVPGPDLLAEAMPFGARSNPTWNFVLEAVAADGGHSGVMGRASAMRQDVESRAGSGD